MEEFHRLVKPGRRSVDRHPHYTDFSSFCDPTHRWPLNSFSLRYFGDRHGGFGYYSPAKFLEISTRVKLLVLWKWLALEGLLNASPRLRLIAGCQLLNERIERISAPLVRAGIGAGEESLVVK
jgi:hypothetical protein